MAAVERLVEVSHLTGGGGDDGQPQRQDEVLLAVPLSNVTQATAWDNSAVIVNSSRPTCSVWVPSRPVHRLRLRC